METDALTPEQQLVVDSSAPQLTVRAAAGSGKTRTLVKRYVKHVREDRHRPDQILTITYTNKAAAEMKKRIRRELVALGLRDEAQVAETGPIQTIHAFCDRLLRENAIAAGIDPKFEIMDSSLKMELTDRAFLETLQEDEERPLVAGLIRELSGKWHYEGEGSMQDALFRDVEDVLSKIRGTQHSLSDLEKIYVSIESLSQAMGVDHDEPTLKHTCGLMQVALSVWRRLEQAMAQRQSFDFAELERRAVSLLEEDPPTAERARRQYKVVLVDEAQDLNPMQYRLLSALGIESEMLVGDPQQSIYSFRQADLKRFVTRSEETESVRLGANFRSGKPILTLVDEIFSSWWKLYDAMDASTEKPATVEFWDAPAYSRETIAEMVSAAIAQGHAPGDIAILLRTNKQATGLPELLAKRGIQSRILGGAVSYFRRMHVRDLANLLEAVADPGNELAFYALLRSPVVALSLDAIVILANPQRKDQGSLVRRLRETVELGDEDRTKIEQFLEWFDPLHKYADRLTAWEALTQVFCSSPYLEKIASQPNGRQALANARKLLELAVEDRELGPTEFARKIRLTQRTKDREGDAPAVDDNQETVKILTIHKAKGLEFPVVIVPDLYDRDKNPRGALVDQDTGLVYTNYLGHEQAAYKSEKARLKEQEKSEDQRVLYVALTRAEERLMVCAGPSAKTGLAQTIATTLGLGKAGSPWKVIQPTDSQQPDSQSNAIASEDQLEGAN